MHVSGAQCQWWSLWFDLTRYEIDEDWLVFWCILLMRIGFGFWYFWFCVLIWLWFGFCYFWFCVFYLTVVWVLLVDCVRITKFDHGFVCVFVYLVAKKMQEKRRKYWIFNFLGSRKERNSGLVNRRTNACSAEWKFWGWRMQKWRRDLERAIYKSQKGNKWQ